MNDRNMSCVKLKVVVHFLNILVVMLHVKTLKKELIDRLHALGMSISYDNALRLSSPVANAVCEHFKETDKV